MSGNVVAMSAKLADGLKALSASLGGTPHAKKAVDLLQQAEQLRDGLSKPVPDGFERRASNNGVFFLLETGTNKSYCMNCFSTSHKLILLNNELSMGKPRPACPGCKLAL